MSIIFTRNSNSCYICRCITSVKIDAIVKRTGNRIERQLRELAQAQPTLLCLLLPMFSLTLTTPRVGSSLISFFAFHNGQCKAYLWWDRRVSMITWFCLFVYFASSLVTQRCYVSLIHEFSKCLLTILLLMREIWEEMCNRGHSDHLKVTGKSGLQGRWVASKGNLCATPKYTLADNCITKNGCTVLRTLHVLSKHT